MGLREEARGAGRLEGCWRGSALQLIKHNKDHRDRRLCEQQGHQNAPRPRRSVARVLFAVGGAAKRPSRAPDERGSPECLLQHCNCRRSANDAHEEPSGAVHGDAPEDAPGDTFEQIEVDTLRPGVAFALRDKTRECCVNVRFRWPPARVL